MAEDVYINKKIRELPIVKEIENEIRNRYEKGKLKDRKIKDFLSLYYDGDPSTDCPQGCNSKCALECYIDIHKSLINDDGEKVDFKELYMRDGEYYCCGKPTSTLENGHEFCTVCGNEYDTSN